jgi:hypothetical protein
MAASLSCSSATRVSSWRRLLRIASSAETWSSASSTSWRSRSFCRIGSSMLPLRDMSTCGPESRSTNPGSRRAASCARGAVRTGACAGAGAAAAGAGARATGVAGASRGGAARGRAAGGAGATGAASRARARVGETVRMSGNATGVPSGIGSRSPSCCSEGLALRIAAM